MPIATIDTDILTLEELHSYLKIPKPTLYAMAQNGRLPAAKVGKHWRFRRTEIDEWFKAQQWNRRPLHRRSRGFERQSAIGNPKSAMSS